MIAVRGTVAYLGDASLVYVETVAGQRITCSRPNQRRSGQLDDRALIAA